MNTRLPLVSTLSLLLWFCLFTRGVAAEQKQPNTGGENGRSDISAIQLHANAGDPKAEYLLGRSYMAGTGVPHDYQGAAKWFSQAAAQGFADAEFSLGYLYEHGNGVPRNYRQAFSDYLAAANQGHA